MFTLYGDRLSTKYAPYSLVVLRGNEIVGGSDTGELVRNRRARDMMTRG